MSRGALRKAALGLLGVSALFAAVLVVREWDGLRAHVAAFRWEARPAWLLLAIACGAAALALTGVAWTRLHRAVGGEVRLVEGTAAWLGSNLGRYVPGKVWQLAGLAAWVRSRGDSAAGAVSSSLALQAVTLLTGGAFALALAGAPALGMAGNLPTLGALALALGLLAHPRVIRGIAGLVGRWIGEEAPVRRPGGGSLVRAAVALCIVWGLHGLGFWAFLHGLVGPAAPGPLVAAGTFAGSYVAGYLVLVAPGGLVVREGAMAGLLVAVAGLPWAPAVAVAAAARLWSVAAEVAAFAAALGGEFVRRRLAARTDATDRSARR